MVRLQRLGFRVFVNYRFQYIRTYASGCGIQLDTAVRKGKPGFTSPPKLWWAREITPDLYIAGRPTERQLKYVYEGGFKSILSLFIYKDGDSGNFGGTNIPEYLPTTTEAEHLARSLGLEHVSLIDKKADWWSEETIQIFSVAIRDLPRPILLHCHRGYTITFVTLMHLANLTRSDPKFEPKINSDKFYRIVAAMGLDFTAQHLREIVSSVTGENLISNPIAPNSVPENWRHFWITIPVTKNWFIAGQLRQCDIPVLESTGFKAVVNVRLGLEYNGRPSQEQVTLLNINDKTKTYGDANTPPRQSREMLERSRINPDLDPGYSGLNYEQRNPVEFGDDLGYNEALEREAFVTSSITYYNTPIYSKGEYSAKLFNNIRATLLEAGSKGPVIVHCRSGHRAANIAVLAAALQEGHSLEWAQKRLLELGFDISPTVESDVYNMYKDVLTPGSKTGKKEL